MGPTLPNGIEMKEIETFGCLLLLVLYERWAEWGRVFPDHIFYARHYDELRVSLSNLIVNIYVEP